MQEISKKSANGGSQVSGGFIFDQMDRFAHDFLKKKYNVKGFLFTKEAHIEYFSQICDWNSVDYEINGSNVGKYYYVVIHGSAYGAKNKEGSFQVNFIFVEKDHAYCDTKGE